MAVMPGFIDVHTHSDMELFLHPNREEALCQGVTTEIAGACGLALFPMRDSGFAETVTGIYGCRARTFATCGEYMDALPETGVNVAAQLAHSPLRYALCGFDDRPLPRREAHRLVCEAFEEGACSFSTGLAYYPASFSDTDEIVEICRTAAEYDVPICVHQRSALRRPDMRFDSREEVLEFARGSGIRVHYSHYRTTLNTAGKLDALLEPIERGLSEGLRVTADFYPYPVGAGYAAVNLPMSVMTGGFERIIERLSDPVWRRKILADWRNRPGFISNGIVIHAPRHEEYLNRSYQEIAAGLGTDVPEMLYDLLLEEKLEVAFRPDTGDAAESSAMLENDFIELMRKPYFMFGSDTLPGHAFPHPRSYGAFAKMLRLAIKHHVPLSLFANRASGIPAALFGLTGRGVIAPGNIADICVFCPDKVRECSSFDMPKRLAQGMELVTVNGKIAVRNSHATGICAGIPVKRQFR